MKRFVQLALVTLILVSLQVNAAEKSEKNEIEEGPYYYSVTVEGSYEDVLERLKAALKNVEFGVVSEMKMNETLNKRLGTEIPMYVVLGICNPKHAHKALKIEENIGLMLPCKGLIRWIGEDKYVVSLQNPITTLSVVENPEMDKIGKEVAKSFKEALVAM